jgi:hypothetical protein
VTSIRYAASSASSSPNTLSKPAPSFGV